MMTEKEFSEKYCKYCSSLVCNNILVGVTNGCKDYKREVLGWQELERPKVPSLEPEKYSLELKLGNLTLQIKDVTLTKKQIKNYKKYFNIDARNLDE